MPANHPSEAPDDSAEVFTFDVHRYLRALRRYMFPLIALVAIAITGAVIYTSRQPQVYQARASVQLEPRLPDLLGQGENGIVSFNASGLDYYKQQLQVLASYTLVKQTVQDHQLVTKVLSDLERANLSPADQVEAAVDKLQTT